MHSTGWVEEMCYLKAGHIATSAAGGGHTALVLSPKLVLCFWVHDLQLSHFL